MIDMQEALEFALASVWEAGRVTLGYFQTAVEAERKADNTPVTIADRLAEQRLRQLIQEKYPDHGIIGEEYGTVESDSDYGWIMDPIDGTKSFVAGVPIYSNLLALTYKGEAVLGTINLPALNETIYAVKGGGCFWNGRRAHVSQTRELKEAVALVSGLNYFAEKQAVWEQVVKQSYIQRTWGDAYGYALVATGRADIMLDPAMSLWDAGPLRVIIEEAGGTFTNWQGEATIHGADSFATNGHLYPAMMRLIESHL